MNNSKTQTRRVIKTREGEEFCDLNGYGNAVFTADQRKYREVKNPYGFEGDKLWVRETLIKCQDSELSTPLALYKVDRGQAYCYGELAEWNWRHETRPSIFMPRWASRLTLEITGVRVERLQSITGEDAKAEGLTNPVNPFDFPAYLIAFQEGWDKLNAKRGYSWESNPFVWVIEFRKA